MKIIVLAGILKMDNLHPLRQRHLRAVEDDSDGKLLSTILASQEAIAVRAFLAAYLLDPGRGTVETTVALGPT